MGRKGSGIYFWYGWEDNSYRLALAWYDQCYNEGRYREDSNANCAIIYAQFILEDENQFINLNNPEVQKIVREYKKSLNTVDDLAKVYDKIINHVESVLGKSILLYLVQVTPPKKDYFNLDWLDKIIGDPYSYIVRDPRIINIKDSEEYCDVRQQ